MSEAAKRWEGEIVDRIFPLRKYLGGSDHSAVFLTEYAEADAPKAAIKLLNAERASADLQLTTWRFTAQLYHPNLLKSFRTGRCRIDGNDLLYLVMEFAEENLGDVLRERALTADETRDMLNPVLDALEYLHSKGLVHGDLKPANILATGDQLKLSSDTISRGDESQGTPKKTSVYDPPEAISGMKTAAGDVWALGTTLVEVLTQKVPEWQPGPNREPVVPEGLPSPFGEIARQCLRLEPHKRASVAGIAERLNLRVATASAAAAMAASSGIPIALATAPLAPPPVAAPKPAPAAPAVPAAARPVPRVPPRPPAPAVRPAPGSYGAPQKKTGYVVPLVVGAVVFAAVLTIPRLLSKRGEQQAAASAAAQATPTGEPANSEPPSTQPVASVAPAKTKAEERAAKQTSADNADAPPVAQRAPVKDAAPAGSSTDGLKPASESEPSSPAAAEAAPAPVVAPSRTASGRPAKGEVLDQILPDISQKARDTIHGRVRVGVKVHVDAAGAVSDAELDSAGPSQYFADQALKAAKRWAFTPPEVDGKSVPSEWRLYFVFTATDTKVTPAQTAP